MNADELGSHNLLFVGYADAAIAEMRGDLAAAPRWSPAFAADADAAWSVLRAEPIAIVVLSPPLGPGLASDVRRRFPRVAQLCWPGGTQDQDGSCREPEGRSAGLVEMLERLERLRRSTMNEEVVRVVRDLGALPAVPTTYWNIARVAGRSTSSAADIAAVVQTDPGLTGRVLQLANATIFGRAARISSIAHAVSYLGVELLRSLVLTAHVFSNLDMTRARGFSLDAFQLYSIRVARLAQKFAGSRELGESSFTAGLLHDLGELILAVQRAEEFGAVLQRIARTGEEQSQVEVELLGARHEDVGAHVLDSWGIPLSTVECVAFHHRPREASCDASSPLPYVHAADALYGIVTFGEPESFLDVVYLERCGLGDRIDAWRRLAQEEAHRG